MKQLCISFGLLVLALPTFGQWGQLGSAKTSFGNTAIQTVALNGGDMFWDGSTARFEVPSGSGRHTIFNGSIWLGGTDSAGTLYLAIQTYRQGTPPDLGFFPGPIRNTYTQASHTTHDKNWKITRAQIIAHQSGYQLPGYVPIPAIATWPAHGNTADGQAAQLAPFVDVNQNSQYEPLAGDYPDICGTEAVYTIMNTEAGLNQPTTPSSGLEIHTLQYAYDGSGNEDLDSTVFARYRIINRRNIDLQNVRVGQWLDLDIGNSSDDYIGADTISNGYFGYNMDNYDEDTLTTGPFATCCYGYKKNPSAQGCVFLNQKMSSLVTYQNNFNAVTGNPYQAIHYYRYLQGKWLNGSPITIGGNGTTGSVSTTLMYPGDLNDPNGWSQVTAGSTADQAQTVGATGPYQLPAGGEITLDLAFPYARGSSNLNSVTKLKERMLRLRTAFANGGSCPADLLVLSTPEDKKAESLGIYPNPAAGVVQVQLPTGGAPGLQVFDLVGRLVKEQSVEKGQQVAAVDLRTLAAGTYILQMASENGVRVAKLVKE